MARYDLNNREKQNSKKKRENFIPLRVEIRAYNYEILLKPQPCWRKINHKYEGTQLKNFDIMKGKTRGLC